MKIKTLAYAVCVLLLNIVNTAPAHSEASHEAGNGGGAFICSDPTQSEFFDLWEAENPQFATGADRRPVNPPRAAVHIARSNESADLQIERAFRRLSVSPDLVSALKDTYAQVRAAQVTPVPAGAELAWPEDEENKYTKAGCAAKAIILYHDLSPKDLMDLDLSSLAALPQTDQAAVWVHETIYKFLRKTQTDNNSIKTRQIVAQLFSTESDQEVQSQLHTLARFYFGPITHGLELKTKVTEYGVAPYFSYPAAYPGEHFQFKMITTPAPELSDVGCDFSYVSESPVVLDLYWAIPPDGQTYLMSGLNWGGGFFGQKKHSVFSGTHFLACILKITLTQIGGAEQTYTTQLGDFVMRPGNHYPDYQKSIYEQVEY